MPKNKLPVSTHPLGKYREQYGVIIICHDEHDQASIYERLKEIGRPLRVVTT